MTKSALPNTNSIGSSNLTNEYYEYDYLYNLVPRTTSGDISFTSSSSNLVYSTATYSSGKYVNQGQSGMLLILGEILINYLIGATDFNNKVEQADFAAHLADYVKQVPYAVDSGTVNTYAVTLSPAPTAYVDGMAVAVKIATASTGVSTLNVNSLGAKPILDSLGNAITSGGLKAGIIYSMRYNSTTGNFIVQGKGGGGNATAAQLLLNAIATVDTGQITGTMPDYSGYPALTSTYAIAVTTKGDGAGNIVIAPPNGYYISSLNSSGFGSILANDPNFIPANILSGKSIFGVAGSAKKLVTGTVTGASGGVITVTGLPFSPTKVKLYNNAIISGASYFAVLSSTQDIPGLSVMQYGVVTWNYSAGGHTDNITTNPMTADGFSFTDSNLGTYTFNYSAEG